MLIGLDSLTILKSSPHFSPKPFTNSTDEKPIVDCSFITDFEDHIFVTVDAEAFFFLHDLITSYVREKDRVVNIDLYIKLIRSV